MKSNKKKKKENKKESINGFEPGYEDPDETDLKEAKRRIEESKKPYNPMDFLSTKNIIIFIIWYSLYRIFLYFNLALVYFMLTIIALIFLNLGERKPGHLSAYSVFNPNNEIEHIRRVEREINEEVNRKVKSDSKKEIRKEYLKSKAEYSLNSNCKCGSGKKYKNCCLKKIK